jgi:N-glycosylase/DNA lyase
MLFAYQRLDAFPVDVWIQRVMASEFPGGFPFERFSGVSGIFQQHLFCYARAQSRSQLVK